MRIIFLILFTVLLTPAGVWAQGNPYGPGTSRGGVRYDAESVFGNERPPGVPPLPGPPGGNSYVPPAPGGGAAGAGLGPPTPGPPVGNPYDPPAPAGAGFGPPLPGEFAYGHPPLPMPPAPTVRDFSWIYIDHPTDRAFKVNDIVTVIVSERSEVTLNSRFNRQRNASLKSELKEFVKLDGLTLRNSATTSPTIDMNQQERIQATGQVTDQEGITYRIAATVVDIRPNGNLVLEARKKINANDDLWEYTLHGEVRYEDVLRNNTVLSENIANLNIEKRLQGRVHASTGRRWGNKLIDMFWPF